MPTGMSQAFEDNTLDLWLAIAKLSLRGVSVGSTHKPFLSWLSVYVEGGVLVFIAIFCLVLYLLLQVRLVVHSYPQRILASSLGTGMVLILLLGLQENYWEIPQAILVGLLILKVQYAVLMNPETRNRLI